MKDYWREESLRTRPEAEIYDILAEKKVPHVATMVLSSAYPPIDRKYFAWKTLFNATASSSTPSPAISALSGILVSYIETSVAEYHDYSHARRTFIDWDLCLVLDFEGHTHRPGRTGTWQFMSINLLQGGKDKQSVVHTLDDDRESAFWVLALLLFDHHTVDAFGRQTGGHQKTLELPICAEDSSGVLVVRYKQPSSSVTSRYEARLAAGGDAVADHPVEIYKARLERRANPRWLYETLRHHASLIPLPANALLQ
ncbi:hypothetical protein CPB85DRAFT_1445299 [Mucidula mucida]|nr:hypothetical protein CPB85DRAFT_1445299 [Mucidula mucida]